MASRQIGCWPYDGLDSWAGPMAHWFVWRVRDPFHSPLVGMTLRWWGFSAKECNLAPGDDGFLHDIEDCAEDRAQNGGRGWQALWAEALMCRTLSLGCNEGGNEAIVHSMHQAVSWEGPSRCFPVGVFRDAAV